MFARSKAATSGEGCAVPGKVVDPSPKASFNASAMKRSMHGTAVTFPLRRPDFSIRRPTRFPLTRITCGTPDPSPSGNTAQAQSADPTSERMYSMRSRTGKAFNA